MERYDLDRCDHFMEVEDDGEWCKFTDHEADKEAAVQHVESEALKNAAGWNRTVTELREEISKLKTDHEAAIQQAVAAERAAWLKEVTVEKYDIKWRDKTTGQGDEK